jgi:uncharacterized protein involved in type VI secretion and phage assembly
MQATAQKPIEKFYGKYRGSVVNNIDPLQMGRIQVLVPDLSLVPLATPAMPCVSITGKQMGTYVIPQIGSGVWVEFEAGDLRKPIWVGGYWGSAADVPALALVPAPPPGVNIVLQTSFQNTLMLSDVPGPTGGILLKSKAGAFISVSDAGITISNGQGATIIMAGPTVTINQGALVIT